MYQWLRRFFSRAPGKAPQIPAAAAMDTVPVVAAAAASIMVEHMPPALGKGGGISALQRHDIDANFTDWLFENGNNADIFTNRTEDKILAALDRIVSSGQSGAALVRRMPGVIPQLLQRLRTENFSGAELARLIAHDVVLVAAVVRLANNALYNSAQSIDSIENAVLVIGHDGLRQLITIVTFRPIIDLNSGQFTKSIAPRLWNQSEKCAIAARLLCQDEQGGRFEAFMAGLVQNAGLIAALRVIDQLFDGSEPIGSGSFCNTLVQYTRSLSCSIAREWRFPEPVVRAIEEQGTSHRHATLSSVGKILATGDYLSKVHILTHQNRLNRDDPRLTRGLADKERDCLKALDQMVDVV